eukprot:389405-Amorphochlora_amoeboformis.AAC.1
MPLTEKSARIWLGQPKETSLRFCPTALLTETDRHHAILCTPSLACPQRLSGDLPHLPAILARFPGSVPPDGHASRECPIVRSGSLCSQRCAQEDDCSFKEDRRSSRQVAPAKKTVAPAKRTVAPKKT